MLNWLGSLLDRLFAVAGALLFSQAPQFFQQYSHRLAGHVSELQVLISNIQTAAARTGKGLSEYVYKFTQHADVDFSSQGEMMNGIISRHIDLKKALISMQDATALSRPFHFLQSFNLEIAQSTLRDFQPGLLITAEGLAYALVGMGVGIAVYQTLRLAFKALTDVLSPVKIP